MLRQDGKSINSVLAFDIDDEVVKTRIAGRRVHPASGRSYHLQFNPPKVEGKDDVRDQLPCNACLNYGRTGHW